MSFTYTPPLKVIAGILQNQLGLNNGQVMTSNSTYEIPTSGLFIAVSYAGPARLVSQSDTWQDDGEGGLDEVQSNTYAHIVQIDMMAYNDPDGSNQARDRMTELAMALASIYAEQQMELYNMQIARNLGPIVDNSFLQDTRIITRYTASILTTSLNIKILDAAYYDVFINPPLLTINP